MTAQDDRLGAALDEQAAINFELDRLAREFDRLAAGADEPAHPDTEPAGPPDPDPEPDAVAPPTLRTGVRP